MNASISAHVYLDTRTFAKGLDDEDTSTIGAEEDDKDKDDNDDEDGFDADDAAWEDFAREDEILVSDKLACEDWPNEEDECGPEFARLDDGDDIDNFADDPGVAQELTLSGMRPEECGPRLELDVPDSFESLDSVMHDTNRSGSAKTKARM